MKTYASIFFFAAFALSHCVYQEVSGKWIPPCVKVVNTDKFLEDSSPSATNQHDSSLAHVGYVMVPLPHTISDPSVLHKLKAILLNDYLKENPKDESTPLEDSEVKEDIFEDAANKDDHEMWKALFGNNTPEDLPKTEDKPTAENIPDNDQEIWKNQFGKPPMEESVPKDDNTFFSLPDHLNNKNKETIDDEHNTTPEKPCINKKEPDSNVISTSTEEPIFKPDTPDVIPDDYIEEEIDPEFCLENERLKLELDYNNYKLELYNSIIKYQQQLLDHVLLYLGQATSQDHHDEKDMPLFPDDHHTVGHDAVTHAQHEGHHQPEHHNNHHNNNGYKHQSSHQH